MSKGKFFKKMISGIFFPVLFTVLAACGTAAPVEQDKTAIPETQEPTEDNEPVPVGEDIQEIQSDQDRITYSEDVDVSPLVEGNTTFAFDMYREIRDGGENLIYSPYSISLALAMTYAGAEGETARQMAETMHYTVPGDNLHASFNILDQKLQNLGEVGSSDLGDPLQLQIANALWGQKEYSFLDSFLELLARNYGAGLKAVDFMNNPEGSRETINQWVSDQTEGKITDLIPGGGVTTETRLVLTNAIYFKAGWMKPFDGEETRPGEFTTLGGEKVEVPMMGFNKGEVISYYEGKNFQVVELPYLGYQASMLVIVPEQGSFEEFENDFNAQQLAEIRQSMTSASVQLRIPKYEFRTNLNLVQTLAEMGMELPLSKNADFSAMTGGPDLYISNVFHQAFISVDEEGTEASAATAVAMDVTSIGGESIELTVDRPFIFLIQENQTGTILFMGRVLNPAP